MTNTSKNVLAVIGVIVIILAAGGIFLWTQSEEMPTATDRAITVTDSRILLTPQNLAQYNSPQNQQCDEQFNSDPANAKVSYSSPEKGIAFDVPYNSNWGNSKFRIEPYWEDNGQVSFGTIRVFEACAWIRTSTVYFRPQRSADEVVNAITRSDPPELIPVPPTIIQLNNLAVVKYATSGMCAYPALQVIGKKYNYEFSLGCSTNIENDFKSLEEIVKSAELIEQPVVRNNKPIITYPANGSTVNGVTIKGTAKPNSEIWAYVNYPENELACISINSYASGGASTVDSKGNFEFALAEPCSKELTVVVSTEEPAADKTGACRSSENVSEPITFTNSGELPGICNQ